MGKVILGTAIGTLIGFISGVGLTGVILARDEERGVETVRRWAKEYKK